MRRPCSGHQVCVRSRVEGQLLRLRLQPQQPSEQSAADQLADMLTCCNITSNQMVDTAATLVS